jgi:hypothetical protein
VKTTRTNRAVAAFIAADPARRAPGGDEAERERILQAVLAAPRAPRPERPSGRTRRWQRRSVGLGVALVCLTGAGGVAAMTGVLPVGNDLVGLTAEQAREELRLSADRIPVAPGVPDPGSNPIDDNANYAQGWASMQLLARRMCTWDKRLLAAIAEGDAAVIASTKAELARPLWYMYYEPSSGDHMRRIHAEAGPGHTKALQQHYDVNCRDIVG